MEYPWKINDVELKFVLAIPTLERHVSTKGNLKIYYFIASMFVQMGHPCAHTLEH